MAIDLKIDESLRRVDIHERYGGRRQGGISPSRQTDNVFVFTDPAKGLIHGYLYDGWREDGLYHYTGEGQYGDQLMAQGNRAIRDHQAEGRDLHLFGVSGGMATYLGPFEYVDHYQADAPETGDGPIRNVFVFRLRPLAGEPGPSQSKVDQLGTEELKEVPVEQHLTESMLISPTAEPRVGERREQKLVRALQEELVGRGHSVCRLQLRPADEPAPLFCDLYDKTTNTVYEAKASVARPAFRMAIGQLADYARFLEPAPRRAILAPQRPRPDLLRLAETQGVSVAWPAQDDGFEGLDGSEGDE